MNQLIVTERNGVLAVFTHTPEGGLRQRLIMDAEGSELNHLELAHFASRLGDEFGWTAVQVPNGAKRIGKRPAATAATKAVAPATRKRKLNGTRRVLPRGIAAERVRPLFMAEVLDYLRAHPGAMVDEVASAIDMHDRTVFGIMSRLVRDGAVRYEQRNMTAPRRYWPVDAVDNDQLPLADSA